MAVEPYPHLLQGEGFRLPISPMNTEMIELRCKADKLKRARDRDLRREKYLSRKQEEADNRLLQEIQDRGVTLSVGSDKNDESQMARLESRNPLGVKVHMDWDGTLHWPVLFVYPEHQKVDFISDFNENDSFMKHLSNLFFKRRRHWDVHGKYKPEYLKVYYRNDKTEELVKVKKSATLSSVLRDYRYTIHGGTPGFIILV